MRQLGSHIMSSVSVHTSGQPTNKNQSYLRLQDYKFLSFLFKIIGLAPLTYDAETGVLRCRLCSTAVLYGYVVFLVISVAGGYVAYIQYIIITTKPLTYDEKFLHICLLLFQSVHGLPVIGLFELSKIHELWESWNLVGARYHKVTGKRLVLSFKTLQRAIILTSAVMVALVNYAFWASVRTLIAPHLDYPPVDHILILMSLVYTYYTLVCVALSVLWLAISTSLKDIAVKIQDLLKMGPSSPKSVEDILQIWVKARDITDQFGEAFSFSVSYYLVFLFLISMGFMYRAVTVSGFDPADIIFLGCSLVMGSIYGECAHRTTQHLGDKISTILADMICLEQHSHIKKELKWFAQSVNLNPPTIALSGFVKLNRGFNSSVLSSMMTYLVVLIQFRTS